MLSPVINKETLAKLPIEFEAWQYLSTDKISVLEINLEPGEEVPLHKNPLDVIFYVIYGYGNITINGNTFIAKTGDCIPIDKDLDRGWLNQSEKVLKLLVVKVANN